MTFLMATLLPSATGRHTPFSTLRGAPGGKIVIALAPVDDAVVIADLAQLAFELRQVRRAAAASTASRIGDAVEGIVARDEHFGLARAADQRVGAITLASQCRGDDFDAPRQIGLVRGFRSISRSNKLAAAAAAAEQVRPPPP